MPATRARRSLPRGRAYAPGSVASSRSKPWKQRLMPRLFSYSPKSSRQASIDSASSASPSEKPDECSITEILITERDLGDALANGLDRGLELVLLGAGHAHHVALDGRRHLELRVLQHLHD